MHEDVGRRALVPFLTGLRQRLLEPRAGAGEVVDVLEPLSELPTDARAMDARLRPGFALVRALDQVPRQPSTKQQARPGGAEKGIDQRVRVGAVALGVEQAERGSCVAVAASGVEVAVDRQFRMTRRLQRAVARRRDEGLFAASDRRRAAFTPVVEPGKIE